MIAARETVAEQTQNQNLLLSELIGYFRIIFFNELILETKRIDFVWANYNDVSRGHLELWWL